MAKNLKLRILNLVVYLAECVWPGLTGVDVIFTIRICGNLIEGEIEKMELKEGQRVKVTASLKTAAGHDAAYQNGTAVWESSDPELVSVEVNPENELEAEVVGLDGSANGSALVTFNVDGDPDADETRDVIGTLAVTVTQGEATVVDLTAGTPEDVPTA